MCVCDERAEPFSHLMTARYCIQAAGTFLLKLHKLQNVKIRPAHTHENPGKYNFVCGCKLLGKISLMCMVRWYVDIQ